MSRRTRPAAAGGRSRSTVIATALILIVVALAALYVVLRPDDSAPLAEPVAPRYPDLSMGPLEEITVGITETGGISVRFPAMITNIGEGAFLVRATRAHPLSDDWTVTQRIDDADGLFSQRETQGTLVWGGDGHDHWHVKEVESHRVETMDGTVLGEVVKAGFCFFDTDQVDGGLPGAPASHHYGSRGCGGQLDMGVHMGLSVGWGDRYPSSMFDQTIRIPELPDGHYVIRMVADPFDWFVETDETNNAVATEISVGTGVDGVRTVEIIGPVT